MGALVCVRPALGCVPFRPAIRPATAAPQKWVTVVQRGSRGPRWDPDLVTLRCFWVFGVLVGWHVACLQPYSRGSGLSAAAWCASVIPAARHGVKAENCELRVG